MNSAEPPTPDDAETATSGSEQDDKNPGSVVAPPAYPAYGTPPPRGLHTGEDG
jgi:hypothetical protein